MLWIDRCRTEFSRTIGGRASRPALLLFCLLTAAFLLHQRAHAAPPKQTNPAPQSAAAFVVVIDAAHGGADTGARLGDGAAEKDATIALSQRLHVLLDERGFTVVVTRQPAANGNADADLAPQLSPDQRAAVANHAHAQACLILHATATGNGLHLFTSSLSPAAPPDANHPARAFTPWQTAQAAVVTRSIALSAEINAAFSQAGIPVTFGRTYLPPMDSMTCPVVAVEVAPLMQKNSRERSDADNADYQQRVAETLAWSLEQWRSHTTGAAALDDSLNPSHAAGGNR